MSKDDHNSVSLFQLFWNFFLVGSYSFGGYMSLISIVRKDFVERKNVLTDEQILDGVSLASILPGPVAVNAVVYYGFVLSGIKGAIASFAGILLPTFLLVTGFSVYYFSPVNNANLDMHISFVIPAIVAVIVSVGFKMAKKQIRFTSQGIIAILALVVAVFAKHVLILILTIIFGGIAGYFLYRKEGARVKKASESVAPFLHKKTFRTLGASLLLLILFVFGLAFLTDQVKTTMLISSVFSSMSLTLFGGGYVIIPIMEQALVGDLAWVSIEEFNAAISISQITPGPIMTSVTFIGYKIAGITGAISATLAIFVPSALLMIGLSQVQQRIKHLSYIDAIMKGMRAVVIGLIFSGAYAIGANHFDADPIPWVVFLVSLMLFLFTKMHPALIILITLLFSFI